MLGGLKDPAWSSREVSERAYCLLAPNAGDLTLDGTNTWLLREPGTDEVVVIDPGPHDEGHLRAVVAHVADAGARVALTLLTHGHSDHAAGAGRFAELTGAPTRALADLTDGELLRTGALELLIVPTPGHTSDSISLLLPAENALLTGDTVLGRGTAFIAHPDGRLGAYLESLERIEAMTAAGVVTRLLPGHGPVLDDAAGVVRSYLDHRAGRLDEVRAALVAGARDVESIVERVYALVPRSLLSLIHISEPTRPY